MNRHLTDQPENKFPDDILQQAIESIDRETIPPGPPRELVTATLRALDGFDEPLPTNLRFVPRGRIMKFAAIAASLLLATSLLARFIPTVESPHAFGEEFVRALKQVREAALDLLRPRNEHRGDAAAGHYQRLHRRGWTKANRDGGRDDNDL